MNKIIAYYRKNMLFYKRSCDNCSRQISKPICEFCSYEQRLTEEMIHPGQGLEGRIVHFDSTFKGIRKIKRIAPKKCISCDSFVNTTRKRCAKCTLEKMKLNCYVYLQAKVLGS